MRYTAVMRLLGIDYGTKKIGLALSDEAGRFATPYDVISSDDLCLSAVADICIREKVGQIVIGRSLNYDGLPNPVQAETEKFVSKLAEVTGLPYEFELEVLTTKEAERDIGKDALTDARAAALILKSYIDRKTNDR